MYREPPEKDPKPRHRRSTDGVTAAQLSKFIVPVLLAAAVVFLLLFFWQWTSYQKSDEEYQTLRAQLVWMDTSTSGQITPRASRLDFTALKEQNPDVTAWLSDAGLELSLPVVQNEDSNYYLRRSFSGGSSNDGCLIRPSWDSTSWADGLCHVIHGHNIHNGAMVRQAGCLPQAGFLQRKPNVYPVHAGWRLPVPHLLGTRCQIGRPVLCAGLQ